MSPAPAPPTSNRSTTGIDNILPTPPCKSDKKSKKKFDLCKKVLENGIKKVIKPDNKEVTLIGSKKQIVIDYDVEDKKEYWCLN